MTACRAVGQRMVARRAVLRAAGGRPRPAVRIFRWTLCFFVLLALSTCLPVSRATLMEKTGFPVEILDRQGRLLRKGLSSNGYFFSFVPLARVPAWVVDALVLTEDQHFYLHDGVDARALVLAAGRNLFTGNPVAGGSTITMQVARNLRNLPRTVLAKAYEIWLAWRIERSFSKEEILELYFNTIPFGGQIVGLEAAARLYFGKPVARLSVAQGAFLVALVRYPVYELDGATLARVKARQRMIIGLLRDRGRIDAETAAGALGEEIVPLKVTGAMQAPHFTDHVLALVREQYGDDLARVASVRTTLDLDMQREAERKAAQGLAELADKEINGVAVVVLDNEAGEIRAMVGGLGYFSEPRWGQVNGALAIRPPGSTLKPFTYATAIELRRLTAASVIPDVRTYVPGESGSFYPENYDREYHGPIAARQALACSYNVAATRVIADVSVDAVLERLRAAGFRSLMRDARHYGASLTLGGADTTLLELTGAYRVFARGGLSSPVSAIAGVCDIYGRDMTVRSGGTSRRVFGEPTTFVIGSILSDNNAREAAFSLLSPLNFPFFCAVKTGTSVGFRNNWTVGWTKTHTVGVWVGNYDNQPMKGINGITGAGTIFRAVMLGLPQDEDWRPPLPDGIVTRIVCPASGLVPKDVCPGSVDEYFLAGTEPGAHCDVHWRVPFHRGTKRTARVREDAADAGRYDWRTLTVLSDIYNGWLAGNGQAPADREVRGYLAWQGGDRTAADADEVRILFPDDGDIFTVDPIVDPAFQALTFRAALPPGTTRVRWSVDGTPLAGDGFDREWPLARGRHTLRLEAWTDGERPLASRSVAFTVR